ncbi:MAG: glycosyltransferase family 39 protein, partial [Chloroflexota bacterium]
MLRATGALPCLVGVTLAAAFLRLYQLHTFPVGFYFDEAANVTDLRRLGLAYHPLYFTANNGREPLYFYWAVWFVRVLGDAPFSLRLASAFLGIATIPAVYFCFSQLLAQPEGRARARRVALFAAAGCAVLFFHVLFSRFGLRTISLPLMECLAFGFAARALQSRRPRDFVLAGALLGLCLYTYTAARLLVPAVLLFALYWLAVRRRVPSPRGLVLLAGTCIVVALPLGVYALRQPSEFFQRTQGVAVLNGSEVLANVRGVAAMFFLRGSINGANNIVGLPLFDWPMRVAFLVGVILLLARLRRPVYVFVLIWLASIALASIFSPDAPYYVRLTGLIPPAVLVPALALAELPGWLRAAVAAAARLRPSLVRKGGIGAGARLGRLIGVWSVGPAVGVLLASGGITVHHYFQVWGPSNDTYFWMMQDKVDAANSLDHDAQRGAHVFLAPLFAQDWTFLALTHGHDVQSFNVQNCLVLPAPGMTAVYAFPPYDVTQPDALLARLRSPAAEQPVLNALEQPVLIEVRLPADRSAARQVPLGIFGGSIGLAAVHGLPAGPVARGSALHLTLVWRSLAPVAKAYTIFLHADNTGRPVRLQHDGPPCGGTFPTSTWRPGDEVFDPHTLAIPAGAVPGRYVLTTGLYAQPGPVNLPLTGSRATELRIGAITI